VLVPCTTFLTLSEAGVFHLTGLEDHVADNSPRSKGAAELRESFLRASKCIRPERFVIRWADVFPNRRPPEAVFPVEEAELE